MLNISSLVAQACLPESVGDAKTVDHWNNNATYSHRSNLSWMSIKDDIVKEKARHYRSRNSDGDIIDIINLAEYSRDFDLDKSNL